MIFKKYNYSDFPKEILGTPLNSSFKLIGGKNSTISINILELENCSDSKNYEAFIAEGNNVFIGKNYNLLYEFDNFLKLYGSNNSFKEFRAEKIKIYKNDGQKVIIQLADLSKKRSVHKFYIKKNTVKTDFYECFPGCSFEKKSVKENINVFPSEEAALNSLENFQTLIIPSSENKNFKTIDSLYKLLKNSHYLNLSEYFLEEFIYDEEKHIFGSRITEYTSFSLEDAVCTAYFKFQSENKKEISHDKAGLLSGNDFIKRKWIKKWKDFILKTHYRLYVSADNINNLINYDIYPLLKMDSNFTAGPIGYTINLLKTGKKTC